MGRAWPRGGLRDDPLAVSAEFPVFTLVAMDLQARTGTEIGSYWGDTPNQARWDSAPADRSESAGQFLLAFASGSALSKALLLQPQPAPPIGFHGEVGAER